jgi:hypothetical protein
MRFPFKQEPKMELKTRNQLWKVISYLWKDEKADFESRPDDEHHIFLSVLHLRDWLEETEKSPQEAARELWLEANTVHPDDRLPL